MARLRASTPRRIPRQSRDLSCRTAAAISARSRSRRASGAVRPRSTLREGAFCCAKHRACLWRPVRCRRIVRASSARMPTAATAIDACSERQKQTAGSRAPKAASAEGGGRRQSDLRGWRASTRVELSFPFVTTALFFEYEDVLNRPEQRLATGMATEDVLRWRRPVRSTRK